MPWGPTSSRATRAAPRKSSPRPLAGGFPSSRCWIPRSDLRRTEGANHPQPRIEPCGPQAEWPLRCHPHNRAPQSAPHCPKPRRGQRRNLLRTDKAGEANRGLTSSLAMSPAGQSEEFYQEIWATGEVALDVDLGVLRQQVEEAPV